jgi:hypothetical protein
MAVTDRRVRDAFVELTDTLVRDFDIIDFLERLAGRCAELLGVSACGVLLVDHLGVLNLVAASTEEARLVELAQLQSAQGPCMDAYRTGAAVQQSNLIDRDQPWPAFARAARASGFAAVHALPMRLREQTLGAMNLLNDVPGPLDDDTIALGQALADAATIGILHQRAMARHEIVAEQLQTALNSRIVIEQAKGFLAERLTVSVDAAFGLLRAYARDHNLKLTAVATDVVEGRLQVRRPLQDRAARGHLDGGDAPGEKHDEPAAMRAAEHAVIFREGRDDTVHDLVGSASRLVGDIQALAANEADTQHDLCHGHTSWILAALSPRRIVRKPGREQRFLCRVGTIRSRDGVYSFRL